VFFSPLPLAGGWTAAGAFSRRRGTGEGRPIFDLGFRPYLQAKRGNSKIEVRKSGFSRALAEKLRTYTTGLPYFCCVSRKHGRTTLPRPFGEEGGKRGRGERGGLGDRQDPRAEAVFARPIPIDDLESLNRAP
jgi:hypothetical protein